MDRHIDLGLHQALVTHLLIGYGGKLSEERSMFMREALERIPINLDQWIDENKQTLLPPIGNRQLWKEGYQNIIVMMVGGPNFRPDFHDDPGEELFIQLHGAVTLKLIDPVSRQRSEVVVHEGEIYLLPAHVRHSPQRPENTFGLVIERYRQPGEIDALEWYDADGSLEFRGEFFVRNIEQDLAKVQAAWKSWSASGARQTPTVWRVDESVE
jgi:3-hydroxyanthranilate 3,4-dioxygenase